MALKCVLARMDHILKIVKKFLRILPCETSEVAWHQLCRHKSIRFNGIMHVCISNDLKNEISSEPMALCQVLRHVARLHFVWSCFPLSLPVWFLSLPLIVTNKNQCKHVQKWKKSLGWDFILFIGNCLFDRLLEGLGDVQTWCSLLETDFREMCTEAEHKAARNPY